MLTLYTSVTYVSSDSRQEYRAHQSIFSMTIGAIPTALLLGTSMMSMTNNASLPRLLPQPGVHPVYIPQIGPGFSPQEVSQLRDAFSDAMELAWYAMLQSHRDVIEIYFRPSDFSTVRRRSC